MVQRFGGIATLWRSLGEAVFALPFVNHSPASVPFAWRNLLANKRRLLGSAGAIAFAVMLMIVQIGFRDAFLDSATEIFFKIDGDLFITSSTKYRFDFKDSFSRRQLYAARAVPGVEWVRPIYADYIKGSWKNPQNQRIFIARVLAFDPDQPVFLWPEVNVKLSDLRQPDTAMFDRLSRRHNGFVTEGTESELVRRNVRIVGTFPLGPNFTTDSTVITSDRTFQKLFSTHTLREGELADIEFGVVKLLPGVNINAVQLALRRALSANVSVLTKAELIDLEMTFQNEISPAGPIFTLGTLIGLLFGVLISYQVLFTDVSELLPQYATLKAIGYKNVYLIRVILEQAIFYAVVGFVPAWLVCAVLFKVLGEITLLPLRMSISLTSIVVILTLTMCIVSGLLAVRRILAADPAEIF